MTYCENHQSPASYCEPDDAEGRYEVAQDAHGWWVETRQGPYRCIGYDSEFLQGTLTEVEAHVIAWALKKAIAEGKQLAIAVVEPELIAGPYRAIDLYSGPTESGAVV